MRKNAIGSQKSRLSNSLSFCLLITTSLIFPSKSKLKIFKIWRTKRFKIEYFVLCIRFLIVRKVQGLLLVLSRYSNSYFFVKTGSISSMKVEFEYYYFLKKIYLKIVQIDPWIKLLIFRTKFKNVIFLIYLDTTIHFLRNYMLVFFHQGVNRKFYRCGWWLT